MYIIGGTSKNQKIKTPKGSQTRPTSSKLRESLFNICQNYIQNATFLDLFAGSGAMGLEALSRGAGFVTFVENNRECLRCIKENLDHLNFSDKGRILCGDVFAMLQKLSHQEAKFDIIYADPPYDTFLKINEQSVSYSEMVIKLIDRHPLLVSSGVLFIEDSSDSSTNVGGQKNLKLKNSRKMGRSVLQQYEML